MNPRREFITAVALCGAGAALVLIAAGRTWVRVTVDLPRPLPDTTHALTGQELAPIAGAFGIAGLAGLAGLIATRGVGRLAVGCVLAAFGAVVAYTSARAPGQASVESALAAEEVLVRAGGAAQHTTAWWVVSVAGGALLVLAGALTVVRGRGWPGMSRRYDAPGPRRPDRRQPPARREDPDLWESLDQGRDPTV